MKKCTNCAKDLPDAALHCVFCGTKQPPAPAGAGAQAKTVMGWQASDLLKDMQNKGAQPAPGVQMPKPAGGPPPPAPMGGPPGAMPPMGGPPPPMGGPPPPMGGPPPPAGLQTFVPQSPGPMGGGPAQMAPAAGAASAKTMMVQGPVLTQPAPGAMGGPAQMPPAAPSPAASAATMFVQGPALPQQGPGGGYGAPPPSGPPGGGYGGPPPPMGGPPGGGYGGPPPPMGGPPGGGYGGPPPPMGGPGGPPGGGYGGPPPPMGGPGGPPGGGYGGPPGGGYGGPPGGGYGGPPGGGYGGPPPPMGGPPGGGYGGPPPGYNPQQMGQGPSMGGPMGGYNPQPVGQPMGHMGQPMNPPYLASRTAARVGAPVEPYKDGIKLVLIAFGVLLLAVFAVPQGTDPMAFRWDQLSSDKLDGLGKFNQIYFAAAGLLALVFGLVPLATVARGALTAVLGLVPVVLGLVMYLKDAKEIDWQVLVLFASLLTLVPGLMLRHEYRSQILPRILVTVGALCVIATFVVPEGGGDPPIVAMFEAIGDAPGKAKVGVIFKIVPFVLAVVSLLVWIPQPSSAGAKVIAWTWILVIGIMALVLLLVNGHIGDVIKKNPNKVLFEPWAIGAWTAFIGYGLATIFGKNLEHS